MKGKNYIIQGSIDCNDMASNGNYLSVDKDPEGKCIEIFSLEQVSSIKPSKIQKYIIESV